MMSDEEQEEDGSFRVRDRRQFTAEGERRPDSEVTAEEGEAESRPQAGAEATARPPEADEPATAGAPPAPEPARKRTFKDRLLGRKDPAAEGGASPGREPAPRAEEQITFPHFILSLMTQTLMHLGEVPDPFTNERQHEPALAKQTIDLIAMLEEKTRGNLSEEEERMVAEVLYDLRMRYVKATGGSDAP